MNACDIDDCHNESRDDNDNNTDNNKDDNENNNIKNHDDDDGDLRDLMLMSHDCQSV